MIGRLGALAALAIGLCLAGAATGETFSKADCITAHVAAQKHKNNSELVAAKRQLITCAQASCPTVIRSECGRLLDEVEAGMPTIVITAEDSAGKDIADVRVTLDGNPLVEMLDGKPIPFDPGAHRLRFERPGSPPIEQQIIVRAGVKYREVKVRFEAAGVPTATPTAGPPTGQADPSQPDGSQPDGSQPADSSGVSPLVYVGFAVAGVGVLVGAITGGISLSQQSTLKEECTDDICAPEKEDELNTAMALGHVSTASFVVAGIGAVVGVVGLIVVGSDSRELGSMRVHVGLGSFGLTGRF